VTELDGSFLDVLGQRGAAGRHEKSRHNGEAKSFHGLSPV
jgi:hypothetical protein